MNREEREVRIPFSYYREWQDGFGARGWKLDCSIGDPAVIAATAETGERIPTSVFIHDILDHHLCGLPMSGHRNEAIALIQLASRTGADPRPDFAGMVREDLMQGQVNGEPLRNFLPPDLVRMLPEGMVDGRAVIDRLSDTLGQEVLGERLIRRFFDLGESGADEAARRYQSHGLDYARRGELGLALQALLVEMDRHAVAEHWREAHGEVVLTSRECGFVLSEPQQCVWRKGY
ncbi:MAG: hypothetical protein R6X15_02220 [Pseudomonadota bacterium]